MRAVIGFILGAEFTSATNGLFGMVRALSIMSCETRGPLERWFVVSAAERSATPGHCPTDRRHLLMPRRWPDPPRLSAAAR